MKTCWLCGNAMPETVKEKLKTPIEELGLSSRARNCLRHSGVEHAEQLLKLTDKDLYRIRNMGPKTKAEVLEKIKALKK